jgi:hypothetical protein
MHIAAVRQPLEYVTARAPAHVWIVRTETDSLVRMDLPEVRDGGLTGFIRGRREHIPLRDLKEMRGVQIAPVQTVGFGLTLGLVTYEGVLWANRAPPTSSPQRPGTYCDCAADATCSC